MRRLIRGLTLFTAMSSIASANDALKGRWEGVYSCNEFVDSAMTLTIDRVEKGRAFGVFEFQAGLGRGSYTVMGSYDKNGRFQLGPHKTIKKLDGFREIGFDGRFVPEAGVIEGRSPQCSPLGTFRAALAGSKVTAKQSAPVQRADQLSPAETAWVKKLTTQIAALKQARETQNHVWNQLFMQLLSGRVPKYTQDKLVAEYDMARAEVRADGLLDDLASGPTQMSKGGIGRVLFVVDQANAEKLPKEVLGRVQEAGKVRAAEVMRPELQAAAALSANLPASIDGLKQARAALAPIENYRVSLERAFGTIDPEQLLTPLWQRIATIETDPAVVKELRAAFAKAREAQDPRVATEDLLLQVVGPNPSSSKLGFIVPEARRMAAISAISIEDESNSPPDSPEPKASEIADFAYRRVVEGNARLAAQRSQCRSGKYADPVSAVLCLQDLAVDQIGGGLEARLTRIVKKGCVPETPGQQYRCNFLQDIEIYFPAGGQLSPDIIDGLVGRVIPGGHPGGVVDARFTRNASGWIVTWGQLQ